MYLVVGLGNPGLKYKKTRHNVGFEVIDKLKDKFGVAKSKTEHKGKVTQALIAGQKVLLVKPQTYMNLSGDCVLELLSYYKIDPKEELIVISDDIAQATGGVRIRAKGSAGGHNGLKDIIAKCGGDGFSRIRIGVGEKAAGSDLVNHVLGRFDKDDRILIDEAIDTAVLAVEEILSSNLDIAMNKYNTKKKKDK